MVSQILDVVYENGSFRPLKPLDAPPQEGEHLRIYVERPEQPENVLDMMLNFYDGLSGDEIKEIEKIVLDRRALFSGRPAV